MCTSLCGRVLYFFSFFICFTACRLMLRNQHTLRKKLYPLKKKKKHPLSLYVVLPATPVYCVPPISPMTTSYLEHGWFRLEFFQSLFICNLPFLLFLCLFFWMGHQAADLSQKVVQVPSNSIDREEIWLENFLLLGSGCLDHSETGRWRLSPSLSRQIS